MISVTKKKVLLGVTGSIAAYKAIELVRILTQRGLEVKVIMTPSATEFVTPLTFETMTGSKVVTNLWENHDREGIEHIELGAWADVYAIVPATAETIAKIAHGRADSELLAALLVSRAPLLVAPAMNTNMYEHPATQENIAKLKERDIEIIEPEVGDLACGWNGTGRLADVYEISYRILRALNTQDLKGKKVVVTAGPTREMIDPVRFLSNCSSGKMGVAVAVEAFLRGADVEVIHGPIDVKVPTLLKCKKVMTAAEMHEAALESVYNEDNPADIVVMAAAVADVRAKEQVDRKIKKSDEWDSIALTPNPDILADLGSKRKNEKYPFLVGFAVETGEPDELIETVKKKITDKKVNIIVGNLAEEAFDKDTNHVWIIDSFGRFEEVSTTYKSRVARKIFDYIAKKI